MRDHQYRELESKYKVALQHNKKLQNKVADLKGKQVVEHNDIKDFSDNRFNVIDGVSLEWEVLPSVTTNSTVKGFMSARDEERHDSGFSLQELTIMFEELAAGIYHMFKLYEVHDKSESVGKRMQECFGVLSGMIIHVYYKKRYRFHYNYFREDPIPQELEVQSLEFSDLVDFRMEYKRKKMPMTSLSNEELVSAIQIAGVKSPRGRRLIDQLLINNDGFIKSFCYKYLKSENEYEDLVNEVRSSVIPAIKGFKAERKYKFLTYWSSWCLSYCNRWFKYRRGLIPPKNQKSTKSEEFKSIDLEFKIESGEWKPLGFQDYKYTNDMMGEYSRVGTEDARAEINRHLSHFKGLLEKELQNRKLGLKQPNLGADSSLSKQCFILTKMLEGNYNAEFVARELGCSRQAISLQEFALHKNIKKLMARES